MVDPIILREYSSKQYPPGTQNNYVVFLKLFVVTETGKELNFPKGGKGF
jgi:hypothetical protein